MVGRVVVRGARGTVARAAIAQIGAAVEVVADTVGHPAVRQGDVVVDLRGPGPARREGWLADLRAGARVLSASLDPADVGWAGAQLAVPSLAGATIVPCATAGAVLADVLAARAAQSAGDPGEVHTAHLVAERRVLREVATAGLRAELAALLGQDFPTWHHGAEGRAHLAEERRLAWFARPVGPHHAAAVPAPEVLTIPRHVPSARTVRGHLAVPTWQAEVLQAAGNLAARPGPGGRLRRWVAGEGRWVAGEVGDRPAAGVPGVPAPGVRDTARWAVVAEAAGERGVARAWANGTGLVGLAGAVLAVLARSLLDDGAVPSGTPAPAELVAPDVLLDELAGRVDLRWSVIHPEAG